MDFGYKTSGDANHFFMSSATVHIVDDDLGILRAVRRFFRPYEFRVRTYGSATEFLNQQLPPGPACLILDLKMPGINGLQLQQALARRGQNMPIIFVSGKADIEASVRAMKGGAVDFLTKPFAYGQLLAAVQAALARSRSSIAEHEALEKDREAFEKLTPRERQVCIRIAQGLLNKQVGFELGTKEKTIKVQRARVIEKLGANSLADVVRLVERLRSAGMLPHIANAATGTGGRYGD